MGGLDLRSTEGVILVWILEKERVSGLVFENRPIQKNGGSSIII